MPKYYVLTSNEIPYKCWVFGDEVDDGNGRTLGLPLDCDVPYELTEIPEFGSFEGVTVTEKTRFIAFITKVDGHNLFKEFPAFKALIGTPDTTELTWKGTIYGADGEMFWKVGDRDRDDLPNILPPEMFGLSPHRWWGNVFDGYRD